MTNALDTATARLCAIAQALTSVTIKSAPTYPVEDAEPLPFVAAFVDRGRFYAVNATLSKNFPTIAVEFHFSRVNLKQMQQQINAVAWEFPRRLAGDPTLDGAVETILFSEGQPIEYSSGPFEWAQVTTHRLLFPVPVKLHPAPQSTST